MMGIVKYIVNLEIKEEILHEREAFLGKPFWAIYSHYLKKVQHIYYLQGNYAVAIIKYSTTRGTPYFVWIALQE